ncbi:NERD domain-containing protein [Nocardia canadensis]|uniref:NERD domain-containing protein n=1 Tax=Nocardia canadensis TaxID=3065238 RepID=UPI00292EFA6B|nr:NERD domain-containing protein [Nocardia canadensis]
MIVVVADETELEGAEEIVAAAIREWAASEVGGVAIFRCHVPESRGGSVEVDALVCTPQGATVVEVKGFTARQDGVLATPPNGPWTVDGEEAALYHAVRVPNPFVQVRRQVFAAKNLLQQSGIFGWVNAVVALVPQPGAQITLEEARIADGYRAVLIEREDASSLRDYFHAETGRTVRLSVNDVRRVFAALNLSRLLPSRVALADQGFPARLAPSTTSKPAPTSVGLGQADDGAAGAGAGGTSRAGTRVAQASTPGFLAAIDRLTHRPWPSNGAPDADAVASQQESAEQAPSAVTTTTEDDPTPGENSIGAAAPLAGLVSMTATADDSRDASSPSTADSAELSEETADEQERAVELPAADSSDETGTPVSAPDSAPSAETAPAPGSALVARTGPDSADPDGQDVDLPESTGDGSVGAVSEGSATEEASVAVSGSGGAAEDDPSPDETATGVVERNESVPRTDSVAAMPTSEGAGDAVSLVKSTDDRFAEPEVAQVIESPSSSPSSSSAANTGIPHEAEPSSTDDEEAYDDEPWSEDEDPDDPEVAAPGYAVAAGTVAAGTAAAGTAAAAAWSSSAPHEPDSLRHPDRFDDSEHWSDWVDQGRTPARPVASNRTRARASNRSGGPSLLERWRNTPVRERRPRERRRLRIGPGIGLLLFIALFGAGFFAITAVQASRFEMADYDRMCGDRKPFPNAAEYQRDGARPIYLSGELATIVGASDSPAWNPSDTSSVQLIACMRQTSLGDLVQTCQLPAAPGAPIGRTVNLFRATYEITVYELRTGREAGRAIMVGERYSADPANTDPDRCRAVADAPDVLGRRLGLPSTAQVTGFLAPLVHADR